MEVIMSHKINKESMTPEELKDYQFRNAMLKARHVIKDIYGRDSAKGKLMLSKLEKCKTEAEVDNLLAWGRVNLL